MEGDMVASKIVIKGYAGSEGICVREPLDI